MPASSQAGRPRYEVADIVRAHGEALRKEVVLRPEQHRALSAIARCRTAALGGHLDVCTRCGISGPSYNSCRNRHCPKCQALTQERWIHDRERRVLSVGHFHVVFTVPSELYPLMAWRRHEMFGALFQATSQTLQQLGRHELGATLGITSVLHTWTRDLRFHPHIHCLVTAGGLSLDDKRWIARQQFLFPVRVIGALFRGKMMAAIRRLQADGVLDGFKAFVDPDGFDRLMRQLSKHRWVVYAKQPFATTQHLFRYLGRYTHRVGLANSRLLHVDDSRVTFRTRGTRTATLSPVDFLRRLVQHILPPGFVKIRHQGLYASAHVKSRLSRARELLPPAPRSQVVEPAPLQWYELLLALVGRDVRVCRDCGGQVRRWALPRPPLPSNARAPPA